MVNVSILGAHLPVSGEIIRILVNHPETEFESLYSPAFTGRNLTAVHHGLIGESQYNFTDKLNLEDTDLLILAEENREINDKIISNLDNFENLKIISLTQSNGELMNDKFEIGLSEINRKALVRGSRAAYIPSAAIVPALIGLNPLASFLLLGSDIEIEVNLPEDITENISVETLTQEIARQLKARQVSFNGSIKLQIIPSGLDERKLLTKINLKNSLSVTELEKIYDEIYDDHNFTFLSPSKVSPEEVEGTQKTIIHFEKPDNETLEIDVVADARMRGGAGDAVHVLNLFFGLHEKTGLYLKPSRYLPSHNN